MIYLKSLEEIELIRKNGKILAEVFVELEKYLKEGIETEELNIITEEFFKTKKVKSAFKGYHNFPKSICVSINEEVIHGIPSSRRLKNGEIISIDVGIKAGKFYGDAAKTYMIGKVEEKIKLLVEVTETALFKGIEQARVGNRIGDISFAIENHVRNFNFSVVKDFTGHGIGFEIHEDPPVPNFGNKGEGELLKEGMVLAIEPMVNMGTEKVKMASDGWTIITYDHKPSAHFEHTVAITYKGPQILTLI